MEEPVLEVRDQTLSGDLQVAGQTSFNCQFSDASLNFLRTTSPEDDRHARDRNGKDPRAERLGIYS